MCMLEVDPVSLEIMCLYVFFSPYLLNSDLCGRVWTLCGESSELFANQHGG